MYFIRLPKVSDAMKRDIALDPIAPSCIMTIMGKRECEWKAGWAKLAKETALAHPVCRHQPVSGLPVPVGALSLVTQPQHHQQRPLLSPFSLFCLSQPSNRFSTYMIESLVFIFILLLYSV